MKTGAHRDHGAKDSSTANALENAFAVGIATPFLKSDV